MTRQEEIREGIAEIVKSVTGCNDWKAREVAVKVTEKQDSQGVVIKVDMKLPDNLCECCEHYDTTAKDDCNFEGYCGYDFGGWKFAGYVAVEPLIEGL